MFKCRDRVSFQKPSRLGYCVYTADVTSRLMRASCTLPPRFVVVAGLFRRKTRSIRWWGRVLHRVPRFVRRAQNYKSRSSSPREILKSLIFTFPPCRAHVNDVVRNVISQRAIIMIFSRGAVFVVNSLVDFLSLPVQNSFERTAYSTRHVKSWSRLQSIASHIEYSIANRFEIISRITFII